MFDLAILGGGPAGVAAGVYASRKRLKTIFITESFGGQSIVSEGIENWIGTVRISGAELAENLRKHLYSYAGDLLTIKEGVWVKQIEKKTVGNQTFFVITTIQNQSSSSFTAKTVLITTGSRRRRLEVPGADALEHHGITYCASCDGPLFSDMDVAVIGGGNAAFESAAQLLAYTKSVTLFNRSDEFRADPVTVEKVLTNPKMRALRNVELVEIKGQKMVESIVYRDKEKNQLQEMAVQGVFVEIGLIPNTDFVSPDLLKKNDIGQVIVDARNQRSSLSGIWAAGDCTNGLYHQNNIAAGDAVKALEDIYLFLHAAK